MIFDLFFEYDIILNELYLSSNCIENINSISIFYKNKKRKRNDNQNQNDEEIYCLPSLLLLSVQGNRKLNNDIIKIIEHSPKLQILFAKNIGIINEINRKKIILKKSLFKVEM